LLFNRFGHCRVLEKIKVQPVIGRLGRRLAGGTTRGKTAWVDYRAGTYPGA
jgi:hypothetical protein